MILAMLRWWYDTGWALAAHRITLWTKGVERFFSISILLKTWFAPWHRIVSGGGKTIDDKVRASIDNFISRLVGSAVRTAVLIGAFFSLLGVSLAAVFMVGLWPLLPPVTIYFLIRSITG